MRIAWSEQSERRYQALITEQMRKSCHGLTLLAIALFPAFAFLDYYAHREHLRELFVLRFGAVLAFLAIYLLIRRGHLCRRPYPLVLALATIASVSITGMCLVLGGYQSPYYAGVNLIVLALVVVVPAGARQIGLAAGLVMGIYLLGILLESGFPIHDPEALLNNLYFLFATAIIGSTAAHLTDNLRRESFQRFLQVESAKADLRRSRDLLQMDLKSEQNNVDLLVKEITARKAELEKALDLAQIARDDAHRALQLREEFISLASHELNTPLTSLKLQTQMAQRRLQKDHGLPPETITRLVQTYDSQLQRLIRMVGDMFDISRIQAGKLDLELTQVDLEEMVRGVVERTLENMGDELPPVSVRIRTAVRGHWDRFRIEQVVLNLLTNAMKYGASKPIEISLGREDGMAVIEVKDSGIGIARDNQRRIFDRFERAVGTRDFGGLGLGLYISRQIVTAHGGEISVASEPGAGSTFTVRLPAERVDAPEPMPE